MRLTVFFVFPEGEDWAQDTKLFMPHDVEQILLADNANCLAVQTFLRMCNLPYRVEFRKNAEFMSPTGANIKHLDVLNLTCTMYFSQQAAYLSSSVESI